MKIKLTQLDPMDVIQENQVHRIRKQTNPFVVEYIEQGKEQHDYSSWDLQIYCSSEPFKNTSDTQAIYFGPVQVENRTSWQIKQGLVHPWDGEWLVQAMFELVQIIPSEKLNYSYNLEFHRVKKERNPISAYRSVAKITKTKEKPLATILFVQEVIEFIEHKEDNPFQEWIIPLKKKMEADILCLVYPLVK